MKKAAKSVSIIGGADGPTSIFLCGGKETNVLKRLVTAIRRQKYHRKRVNAAKQIVPEWHTIEETKQYMTSKYAAYEADESYPLYSDRMLQLRCAIIQREKSELIGADIEPEPPTNRKDENDLRLWMENVDKRTEKMLKKTANISQETFPTCCHLYIISVSEGTIEIEIEDRLGFMGTSSSGDIKYLNGILKDIYRYYGVSQKDIDRKTPRYQLLETMMSM